MIVTYGTDVGLVRNDNQDAVFSRVYSAKRGLFIVADGMGGHRGGKVASTMAIEIITQYFEANYNNKMKTDQIKDVMIKAVEEANSKIYDKSLSAEELSGMGTTVVMMYLNDKKLYTVSAGDSRAYVCSGTRIYQITTDHSLVANLISQGLISTEEAKAHPQKNVITRAVGSEDSIMVDFFETNLEKNDVVISCSDGLHGLVSDDEIAGVVAYAETDIADKLILLAKEKGGNDNITVVAVKIS